MAKSGKKKTKRYALGGPIGYGGTNTNDPVGRGGVGGTGLGGVSGGINGGDRGRGGPGGGVTTGNVTGTTARNTPPGMAVRAQKPAGPKPVPPMRPVPPKAVIPMPKARPPGEPAQEYDIPDDIVPGSGLRPPGLSYSYDTKLAPGMYPGNYMRSPTPPSNSNVRGMRDGGLARKSVGKTFAKGGMVKAGKGKGKGSGLNKNLGLGLSGPVRPIPTRTNAGLGLKTGGLVKGAGCAQRGVKKPRMK